MALKAVTRAEVKPGQKFTRRKNIPYQRWLIACTDSLRWYMKPEWADCLWHCHSETGEIQRLDSWAVVYVWVGEDPIIVLEESV